MRTALRHPSRTGMPPAIALLALLLKATCVLARGIIHDSVPLAADHARAWKDINDEDGLRTWTVPEVIGYKPLDKLPPDCQANVGLNADDIRGFAVQLSDCASTWNVCLSVNNTVSLDHTIDMLRVIPVSMRRYMSGITTVERYGPGRGVSVLGSSVTYDSFGDLENVLHLASLLAPGWNFAESAEWKAAVDKDACVGDDWASTCYDCSFGRAAILRMNQLNQGRLLEPPDGGSLDCMANQLAFMSSLAIFSDDAQAQWGGATCEMNSDAIKAFEAQAGLTPLHTQGPSTPSAGASLYFTKPPPDARSPSDAIKANYPLLDAVPTASPAPKPKEEVTTSSQPKSTDTSPASSSSSPSSSSTSEPVMMAQETAPPGPSRLPTDTSSVEVAASEDVGDAFATKTLPGSGDDQQESGTTGMTSSGPPTPSEYGLTAYTESKYAVVSGSISLDPTAFSPSSTFSSASRAVRLASSALVLSLLACAILIRPL